MSSQVNWVESFFKSHQFNGIGHTYFNWSGPNRKAYPLANSHNNREMKFSSYYVRTSQYTKTLLLRTLSNPVYPGPDFNPVWPDWEIFLKFLVTNIPTKVAYLEKHYLLSKYGFGYFWATFGNIWVTFYFTVSPDHRRNLNLPGMLSALNMACASNENRFCARVLFAIFETSARVDSKNFRCDGLVAWSIVVTCQLNRYWL